MPTTLAPVDRDTLTALHQGDERALETIFRGDWAALREEAAGRLDDPAAAPRVVERAFLRLWRERERVETPEALESFLHDAVADGVALDRSRRAALHRFEEHEAGLLSGRRHDGATAHAHHAPATVDEAWAHLSAALHPDTAHDAAEARHRAAEHIASVAKRNWLLPVLGGVALVGIVVIAAWLFDRRSADAGFIAALHAPDARSLSSATGQIGVVTLDDGSRVTLGPDSRLFVHPTFGPDVRAVRLEGTAKFDLATGPATFAVVAGEAVLKATGTAFDVRAYPSEGEVAVRVREGSVSVKAGDGTVHPLAAGSAVVVGRGAAPRALAGAPLEAALGWVDGRVVLVDRPLREAIAAMKRWYAYDIYAKDTALLSRPVTLRASVESPREAIAAIERSGGLEFGYERETMVFREAPPAGAKGTAKGAGKRAPPRR